MPRTAHDTSGQTFRSLKDGVPIRRVARNVSQQQLRELLTVLTQSPTAVVLQVGYVLRLLLAVIKTSLPTGDRFHGIRSHGGRVTVSKSSRRGICAAAGAPAARRLFSLTIEEKEQEMAIIATVRQDIKQAKRGYFERRKISSSAVMRSSVDEKAKQAESLQSWSAKAKRSVPALIDLLKCEATSIGIENARLIRSLAEGIPAAKAARVRTSTNA